MRFPAPDAGCMYVLRVLIGSLCFCVCCDWYVLVAFRWYIILRNRCRENTENIHTNLEY